MRRRLRRGIALFGALALTAVITLLAAGGVAFTRLAQRTWRVAQVDASLAAAADYALATVLADAHSLGFADLPIGQTASINVPITGALALNAVVGVTRLRAGVLWLVTEVNERSGPGRRRLNLVVAYPSLGQGPPAAVTSRGNVWMANDVAFMADTSQDPDCAMRGWYGVALPPGASAQGVDASRLLISGMSADSAAYLLTARQLTRLTEIGRWTHVGGDTVIAGGAFSGLLMVDGALTITGPFTATGLVIARGPIVIAGGVTVVTGAVMSFAPAAVEKLAIKFSGVTVRYSPCAVDRAIRGALDPRPISLRSWAEIF